ncbi:hypothetical protein A2V68_02405 [candidate division Kazan bacterium RBG_13_50_9]|uniref:Uncharacterized protein n=1 Tax=candidate division Kazan bacterium RBG_13_50_9 TaxID=1798535 RepID=A0A1F4NRK6_UNCK3|nr:MAG: hypothetical protein A2V68_02405 [candidate division Kazan bacterium RBG_13_50_9]
MSLFIAISAAAPQSALAEDAAGVDIPPGYVVTVSLFIYDGNKTGTTYSLGVILDAHHIISSKRAVLAHPLDALESRLAYRIIVVTSKTEVLSVTEYLYSPEAQQVLLTTKEELRSTTSLELVYNYAPTAGEELSALLLVSAEGEPLEVTNLKLEPVAIEKIKVVITDRILGGILTATEYLYPLQQQGASFLLTCKIHGGIVLNGAGQVVGLLLEDQDGQLFLLPLRGNEDEDEGNGPPATGVPDYINMLPN